MAIHSVKIKREACEGCVNCIRTCPTEGIRVIDGEINILSELCIDCGECMRACHRKALGIEEDDWGKIKESQDSAYIADPSFFTQFSHYGDPSALESMMISNNMEVLIDDVEDAFDLSAYATAQLINRTPKASRPLISVYCPAVFRLIQSKFPELLPRILPIFNPLGLAADLWRLRTNSHKPLTLLAPCPAKITVIREPIGRERSPFDHAVTVRKVARSLMAEGEHPDDAPEPKKRSNRWVAWARRGGESRHVQAFSDKKLTILAVSGMRNTLDALQELELGRLRGVDFIECRVCDTGCVGGIGTADSRFLASLRLGNIQSDWEISEEDMQRAEELYTMDFWTVTKEYLPRPGLPLSDNVSDAMLKLQQMKEIYNGLPHIDCGSCGRPSCQAMAEEIVRGHGSVTDCIFKLREGIATLANRIVTLSESQPQTLKKRSGQQ
ncbi:MAG: [Fe-Fe] hydrogenase large subunit C-terminal domain-containing protein [Synergistaceae bacterium]|nr:[Fe-Fe] hydrogenase large subunit C-terminal domain-containing protein [Synergistaceae bacterium]